MALNEIIHEADSKMKKTLEVLHREFSTVRTGRASASLVEGIKVDYYGNPTPLKQMATITAADPKLIVIQPWDISASGEIEKALLKADLGTSPINDGKLIRIALPQLTQERREELCKVVKKMAEDARVALRSIRRDSNEHVKKGEKDHLITEDESFKGQEDIQKLTDKSIKEIDQLLLSKEKEITAI